METRELFPLGTGKFKSTLSQAADQWVTLGQSLPVSLTYLAGVLHDAVRSTLGKGAEPLTLKPNQAIRACARGAPPVTGGNAKMRAQLFQLLALPFVRPRAGAGGRVPFPK